MMYGYKNEPHIRLWTQNTLKLQDLYHEEAIKKHDAFIKLYATHYWLI